MMLSWKRPKVGLIGLLAMPAMFALGWWVRDRSYDRDVYRAAEEISFGKHCIYIPELGQIIVKNSGIGVAAAQSEISRREMERRLSYYDAHLAGKFDPPRPSLLESFGALFGFSWNPEDATRDGPSEIALGETPLTQSSIPKQSNTSSSTTQLPDAEEFRARVEAFRNRMRVGGAPFVGRPGGFGNTKRIDPSSEQAVQQASEHNPGSSDSQPIPVLGAGSESDFKP